MNHDEQKGHQWLQTLSRKSPDGKKRRWPFRYVILLGCLGIVLMLLSHFISGEPELNDESGVSFPTENEEEEPVFKAKESETQAELNSMTDYERRYENQLRDALEQIIGISDVSVVINLAETERHVYEKNTSMKQQTTDEVDREGGTRKVEDLVRDEELIIMRNGDGEEPILVQKEKPQIRGVLVVAKGVENAQIKGWVVEAVSRLLDVPSHRVSVMPKKTKEDVR